MAEFKIALPDTGDRAVWTAALRGMQRLMAGMDAEEFLFLAAHLEKAVARTGPAGRGRRKKTAEAGAVGEASVPYGRPEEIAIEMEVLLFSFRRRREMLRDSLSATDVAALLGTSRQTPHDRARADTLLAVPDGGTLRFPAWQFDPAGPNGVIAGLPEVLQILQTLKVDPISKLSWFLNPRFEGKTPVDLLRAGELRPVLTSAWAAGPP